MTNNKRDASRRKELRSRVRWIAWWYDLTGSARAGTVLDISERGLFFRPDDATTELPRIGRLVRVHIKLPEKPPRGFDVRCIVRWNGHSSTHLFDGMGLAFKGQRAVLGPAAAQSAHSLSDTDPN